MSNAYSKHRLSAFKRQRCRCYYCNIPKWLGRIEWFASNHSLSKRESICFQCTAEHLVARQEGGKNSGKNIVAACRFCNHTRHARSHQLAIEEYQSLVSRCLKLY